jgi:hypothetical protein
MTHHDDPDTDRAHQQELYATWKKRLQVLELQSAEYGLACPAHIRIEISELRSLIAAFEQQRDALLPQMNIPRVIDPTRFATNSAGQPLRVFLCHATDDKASVRQLYHQLQADGIAPWLDEENLVPGELWKAEIPRAISSAHVAIICLSHRSTTKWGYMLNVKYFCRRIASR